MATAFPSSDLVEAALTLADEQPVLALRPGGKRPLPGHGLTTASQDPAVVGYWWARCPTANVGMRCDGLLVVDVDGEAGEVSLDRLEHRLGQLPATRAAKTGKGRHLFFTCPTLIGNSTAPLGRPQGIDLRGGTRGFVVAPPSRHESGRRYEWLDERPPQPLPASWREPLTAITYVPTVSVEATTETGYGRAALGRELKRLLRARPGGRNEALNLATFKLAQLVGGGQLTRSRVEETMQMAAAMIGLRPGEATITIRSGMLAGLNFPRSPRVRARVRDSEVVSLLSNHQSLLRIME